MTHYDEVLKEARAKATGSAAIYIPRLFKILVDEDKHSPEEARAIVEHDLISYWARTTIRKNLPDEAKDEIKAKAGKEGAKTTNLVLAGGQTQTETVTTPADDKLPAEPPKDNPPPEPPEDDPKDLEIQFLKEQIAQLQDALKKTEQFKPAADLETSSPEYRMVASLLDKEVFEWLEKRDNGVNCYWYPNYGIELFRNRILTQLKNKGVTTFKRLYFEV